MGYQCFLEHSHIELCQKVTHAVISNISCTFYICFDTGVARITTCFSVEGCGINFFLLIAFYPCLYTHYINHFVIASYNASCALCLAVNHVTYIVLYHETLTEDITIRFISIIVLNKLKFYFQRRREIYRQTFDA